MMRILIFLSLLLSNIFAASLLSMSVNENGQNVEINLSFDAPFEGAIEQNASEHSVTLKISGVSIDSKKELSLSQNELITRILMTKEGASTVLLSFETKRAIAFEALKNNDGYKLQLKITPQAAVTSTNEANLTPAPKQQATPIPKPQTDDGLGWRYVVVVSFLAFLIAVMLYIKKRGLNRSSQSGSDWLFPKSFKSTNDQKPQEVQVISQSFLDPNNKLMLVEYGGVRYLLLVGNTNIVVDRYYSDDVRLEESDFKRIMIENERKLSEFLKPQGQLSNFDEYRLKAEGD